MSAEVPFPGKDLLLSRSFWGAVMMLVGLALKAKGHAFDAELATDRFLAFVETLVPAVGFLVSFVGTLFRKGPITTVAGIPIRSALMLLVVVAIPAAGFAQQVECPDPRLAVDLPADVRAWYHNPDGSCVQCSIGMCGVDQNVPAAATLLWDSAYGSKERGGSYPERVARYSKQRGMRIYNVTGSTTFDWMKWATNTGRGAAIGAGSAHFQTLAGYDPKTGTWYVCNNNSPRKIDVYDEREFRRLHLASGPWIVVLDYPPHPARGEYGRWW
ncbi:MAG: hypothetical protein AB7O62_05465 [Pirellulales bacterium]